MKNSTIISIIIPVYNTSQFLNSCIESIVNFYNEYDIEILLINDGSTDLSQDICESWVQKDKRIKLFNQINSGVTKARKKGFENAKGTWIMFVDSDDILPPNAIQSFLNAINSTYIDIIVGDVLFANENLLDTHQSPLKHFPGTFLNTKYLKKVILKKVNWAPWAKIYRKELFNNYIFEIPREIYCGEDMIMNLRIISNAKVIKCIPEYVYTYRVLSKNYKQNPIFSFINFKYELQSLKKYKIYIFLLIYKRIYEITRHVIKNKFLRKL